MANTSQLGYTFGNVYPALAAVEDPLPAYDALPMNDDGTPKPANESAQSGKPITSSLRATNRLLRSVGGWFSNLRGIGFAIVIGLLTGITSLFLSILPFVNRPLANLIAMMALSPLFTTWTHLVITPPSPKRFHQRIPRYRKVIVATWLPIALTWLATHLAVGIPFIIGVAVGLPIHQPQTPGDTPLSGVKVAPSVGLLVLFIALQALLVVPAQTALVRVQASLLPADEDTLVPFDRSFAGRVEPEVVTGKGFATFGAALATLSWSSWWRIYLLRIKTFAISLVVYLVMGAVILVQILLVQKKCEAGEGDDGATGFKCY